MLVAGLRTLRKRSVICIGKAGSQSDDRIDIKRKIPSISRNSQGVTVDVHAHPWDYPRSGDLETSGNLVADLSGTKKGGIVLDVDLYNLYGVGNRLPLIRIRPS